MTGAGVPQDPRSEAAAAGFSLVDGHVEVDPAAVRMLPDDAPGVGVAISGDVLMVATESAPSPAQFRMLERLSGMAVTIAVAGPAAFAEIRGRARAVLPATAPRIAGAVLAEAAAAGASDALLAVGDIPRMRVAGRVLPVGQYPILAAADLDTAAHWLLGATPAGLEQMESVVAYGDSRWLVSAYAAGGARAMVARRVEARVPRLEDLGLPGVVAELAGAAHGLVLFAGAPGAGKTTSAAAFIDRINATRHAHIVTLEAPVEYRHTSLSSVVTQRELGTDVETYSAGVRDAQRHRADVVMVGDLSDRDAVRAALDAASSGQLVVAAVAATSAEGAIHELVALFDAPEQARARAHMAAALRAIVTQQLVPSTQQGQLQPVCEVLLGTDAVRTLVRDGRTHELEAAMDSHVQVGMTTMDRSLAAYVAAGRLAETEARRVSIHPTRFADHLSRTPVGRGTQHTSSP